MDLATYDRTKFELADIVRAIGELAKDRPHEFHDQLRELFARLAEDRFNLVVVGRYNRGKTTLMNAILGSDRLPIGIVPLTSVITTVGYGSHEQVKIHYHTSRLPSEVPLHTLPEYVTQRHNPGNARGVRTAEVKLPAEILRRGFYFIDTPGLESPIAENTRTTEGFLPEADAFVLVTSFESPLSAEELRILRLAAASARRVFVVINKQDLVTAEERSEALHYVDAQLRESFGDAAPRVFSATARDGLAAKLANDASRLTASGIEDFETELTRFLLTDKRAEFLLRLRDRVAKLLGSLPSCSETQRLASALGNLSASVSVDRPGIPVGMQASTAPSITEVWRPELGRCPICEHVLHAAFEFLRRYQYNLSFDFQVRQRHARSGGLCAAHTWRYEALASPHGICTGYPPLLERLSRQLRAIVAPLPRALDSVASHIEGLLPTEATCPLCSVCAEAEADAVAALVARVANEPLTPRGPMVCLPHLASLVAAIGDPETVRALVEREALALERLAEDMHRFALKHDGLRRVLASDEETSASEIGLAVLVGLRHVNSPRHSSEGGAAASPRATMLSAETPCQPRMTP